MWRVLRKFKFAYFSGALAGIGLRLMFILRFPHVSGDSLVYADIAKNWLAHGIFGLTECGQPVPTYIRLPGYPGFIAAIFAIFGADRFFPVMLAQLVFDLGTCFIVSALAYELLAQQEPSSQNAEAEKVAVVASLLTALCPFTANYVAAALSETLSIFFSALALLCALKGRTEFERENPKPTWWIGCGLAISASILLRPDGGILLAVVGGILLWQMLQSSRRAPGVIAGVLVAALSLAPLVPWTIRNWVVFHRFQPLVPRFANAPGEYIPYGYMRWGKTWAVDYVSLEDLLWKISSDAPGEPVNISVLPSRAFDSEEERTRTARLINEFNQTLILSPGTDAGFAQLAQERIGHSRFRYYVWLPTLRIADMWLRPRTEILNLDPRWWEFADWKQSTVSIALGILNLLLIVAAAWGALRYRRLQGVSLLVSFIVVRSIFLMTIEAPEPRYTLECYPAVLALAAMVIGCVIARPSRTDANSPAYTATSTAT